jgi:hypothetical protein
MQKYTFYILLLLKNLILNLNLLKKFAIKPFIFVFNIFRSLDKINIQNFVGYM